LDNFFDSLRSIEEAPDETSNPTPMSFEYLLESRIVSRARGFCQRFVCRLDWRSQESLGGREINVAGSFVHSVRRIHVYAHTSGDNYKRRLSGFGYERLAASFGAASCSERNGYLRDLRALATARGAEMGASTSADVDLDPDAS
jgi:hypothetical protein